MTQPPDGMIAIVYFYKKKKKLKKPCFLMLNVLQNFTKDFMINGKTIFRFKLIDPNLL